MHWGIRQLWQMPLYGRGNRKSCMKSAEPLRVPSFFADIINKGTYVVPERRTDFKTKGFGKEDKEVFL